jgi:hypothetical protein
MSIQQVVAKQTRDVGAGLERTFVAMPADKQTWKPLDNGRSALEQIAECAVINGWSAQVFRDRAVPPFDGEAFGGACAALDTADKAVAALRANTETLVAAIGSTPDDALQTQVQFPWDESPCSLADAVLVAYWNMTYHIGQINYIQTLYGDQEMH